MSSRPKYEHDCYWRQRKGKPSSYVPREGDLLVVTRASEGWFEVGTVYRTPIDWTVNPCAVGAVRKAEPHEEAAWRLAGDTPES